VFPTSEPRLHRLYTLLRQHTEGLSEYALLEILRGNGPLRGLDELDLFQVHFALFHDLYRLRRILEFHGCGGLEIHCLGIRLSPLTGSPPNPDHLPLGPDPLAEYYLDPENLRKTTRDDVRDLMQRFWKLYRAHDRRGEALAVLGLGPHATAGEITRRYRALVKTHHPDRGGEAAVFSEITEAVEILRLT
jgi:hypothetical protein